MHNKGAAVIEMNKPKEGNKSRLRNLFANKWFAISVTVTISLIAVLLWNLAYSYRTISTFESENLPLERMSGELLFYTKSLEMAANMASATGDLSWRNQYEVYESELDQVMNDIPNIIESEAVSEEIGTTKQLLKAIGDLEERSFFLISRGNRQEAFELLSGWNYTSNQMELQQSLDRLVGIMHTSVEKQLVFMNRTIIWLFTITAAGLILLSLSWYTYYQGWCEDAQKRRERESRILYLSYHDSLTGLYNRRYFEEEVKRLNVQRKMPLTIILGDANGLKRINDTLGHHAGDRLLTEMASIIKNAVRHEDVVARWGGDEFGIILPNSDDENAKKVIDRIKFGCEKSDFDLIKPSISLGYAIKNAIDESTDVIFTRAENRMYKEKRKNRKKAKQQALIEHQTAELQKEDSE
ncbi:MAG: GGDEF domain-containing protein [Tindallia sp. MSAO_Bac2]|nr:MAG: GGDEF domain-containing protein [Tindallia sp. MSAO_Bac2]